MNNEIIINMSLLKAKKKKKKRKETLVLQTDDPSK